MARTSLEAPELPEHSSACMANCGHPRQSKGWPTRGSKSEVRIAAHRFGPISSRCGGVDTSSRSAAGTSSSLCSIHSKEVAGSLGAVNEQAVGRSVAGCPDVADHTPRCLPRSSEKAWRKGGACSLETRESTKGCWKGGGAEERSKRRSKRREGRAEECLGRRGDSGLALGAVQKLRPLIPGASATTVLGSNTWELLFQTLSTTRTSLRFSFLSARRSSASTKADFWQVWPMPLPYPEVHLRASKGPEFEIATKKGLNFCILVLNQLSSSTSRSVHATPAFGTKLNGKQWEVVKRLRPLVVEWNKHPPVDAMGRAASKMESVETVLAALETEVHEVSRELRSYFGKASSGGQTALNFRRPVGEVVGSLDQQVAHVAKAVEPDRLRFWKTPTFDPTAFLDPANRKTYTSPLSSAEIPEESSFVPPKVKVRILRQNRVKFLELLDSSQRLQLVPEKDVRRGYLNGVFTVPKDQERDRMVLDARPPNGLEESETRWIRSLASTQQLQHFFTKPGEQVMLFAVDLREFYHAFKISKQRVLRNALEMPVRPAEVQLLGCFEEWMHQHDCLYPALNTMAMGDCNAVAYGQASHLGVILQSQAVELGDFITLTGRPGRKSFVGGLMIDDWCFYSAVLQRISHQRRKVGWLWRPSGEPMMQQACLGMRERPYMVRRRGPFGVFN